MNKILAIIVSTAAIATASLATGTEPAKKSQLPNLSGGKWSIRAFYGFNGGEIRDDAEVEGIFGAGLEYALPKMGQDSFGGAFSLGVEYNGSTEGIEGITMQNYGVYGGVSFPLGQNSGMAGLEALLRVGYFNTRLDSDFGDDSKWGFGFDAGLRYKLQKIYLELFYRQRPSVNGIDNNAITVGVNFPIGN